jgi:hypothetical protein
MVSEPTVDLGDPISVKQGIAQAEAGLAEATQRLTAVIDEIREREARRQSVRAEVEHWEFLARALIHLAEGMGERMPQDEQEPAADASSKVLALSIVKGIDGPTSIGEVANRMPGVRRKTVSWALWKLAEEKAIQRLGHGAYAPLSYRPEPIELEKDRTPPLDPVAQPRMQFSNGSEP